MTLVSSVDNSEEPQVQALIKKFKSGRRGSLLGIYKALLHNPKLAETWFNHLNAVRWGTDLSGRLREILIIRIGHDCKCSYILRQHIPKLATAEGVTLQECEQLQSEALGHDFSGPEVAALRVADSLTRTGQVCSEYANALRQYYSERQIVEIMVLIGTYNMHARFVNGLSIPLEQD